MRYRIIFSDVDGTLLDQNHKVLPGTLRAIRLLQEKGIPFVITSARSPSGIYPILEENHFQCPVIAYSGGLILDEKRNVLFSDGFSREICSDIIAYIEKNSLDCSWNIYSMDTWLVKNKADPRIIREERIVRAEATEGTIGCLGVDRKINKILCMCNPDQILSIEEQLKREFPQLSIAKSSESLLEIMQKGITKSTAIIKLCDIWGIPLETTIAFGDYYNDVEMLETVALPFLMGNAPEELKKRFSNITFDNNNEGIYHALVNANIIER